VLVRQSAEEIDMTELFSVNAAAAVAESSDADLLVLGHRTAEQAFDSHLLVRREVFCLVSHMYT